MKLGIEPSRRANPRPALRCLNMQLSPAKGVTFKGMPVLPFLRANFLRHDVLQFQLLRNL